MTPADYLRARARELRDLAASEPDPEAARKLLDLAERCQKLANEMGGNGHARRSD
jgi:hypothetical protein